MIGKNILAIRKQKGFTLSELAERADISKSYLSNIERNLNKNPSINVLEKIARVLDSDLQSLLHGTSFEQSIPDHELIEFATELKEMGIEKDHLSEYRSLVEYLRWKSTHSGTEN